MKTKDELAMQRYGSKYDNLCSTRQRIIDEEYELREKIGDDGVIVYPYGETKIINKFLN